MSTYSINIRVTQELNKHLQQQIGEFGLYNNASEYIRDLLRKDLKTQKESWAWLKQALEPALRADDSEYSEVTASDVVARNKQT
jgi:putative addiction module CopG family antidote